jgi:hypothetical protein
MYFKKILCKNPEPEFCNKDVERLKVNGRKVYETRKFGQLYQADLKRLSKELLVTKKEAQEIIFTFGLTNEGRCWTEFCVLNDVKEQ